MRRVLGSRQSLVPRIAGLLLPSHLTSFALIDGRTVGTNVDPPQASDRNYPVRRTKLAKFYGFAALTVHRSIKALA
jgi:hypothetical protein